MSEYPVGTKIRVEFDAVVEAPASYDYIKAGNSGLHDSSDYGTGFLKVRDTKNWLYHYVWAGPDATYDHPVIAVIVQPDWEKHDGVRVGDVWEANGEEYFAYMSYGDITLFPVNGVSLGSSRSYYGPMQHDTFGALNPRLVRRRGESL